MSQVSIAGMWSTALGTRTSSSPSLTMDKSGLSLYRPEKMWEFVFVDNLVNFLPQGCRDVVGGVCFYPSKEGCQKPFLCKACSLWLLCSLYNVNLNTTNRYFPFSVLRLDTTRHHETLDQYSGSHLFWFQHSRLCEAQQSSIHRKVWLRQFFENLHDWLFQLFWKCP